MTKSKKIIVIAIFLVIVCIVSHYYLSQPNQKPIPGYISTDIRYISSEEPGRLMQLNIKEGQLVTRGQQLYSLNSDEESNEASANITNAKADLKFAKAEYLRQKALLKSDSTSKKDYQSAYNSYTKALAIVNSTSVKSLEKAYVYQVFYHIGELIPAFNPVLSIINPDDVYVVFYISKEDLHKIHLNQQITVKTDSDFATDASINFISKNAEYTPPILYGINADSEISFEVKAKINYIKNSSNIHIGEPIRVII